MATTASFPEMKGLIFATWRWLAGSSRPSAGKNARTLRERGESTDTLRLRDAVPSDVPALARLHVLTWNATYRPLGAKGPSEAVRVQQWRATFDRADPDWFCVVLERPDGALVGFAQVNRSDNPDYAAELGKIYLLPGYQRLGLGKRLLAHVARRLLDKGATSMWLFGDARNPSAAAWKALGARKTDTDPGNGNYGWPDLRVLLARCQTADYDEPR